MCSATDGTSATGQPRHPVSSMPRMEDPALFLLTVLIILGTPGPTNTLLATSGAAVGWRRSLVLLPAEAAGYLLSILILGLVLGPIVAASPAIALILRLAVGSYLLALALKLWRRGTVLEDGAVAAVRPHQVFVTTLLNPKAIISSHSVLFLSGHAMCGCTCSRSWPFLRSSRCAG